MEFDRWYAAVDAHFIKVTGIDRDSFPDQCYYDWFEDGFTPSEAVAEAIENEYGMEGLEAFRLEI